MSSLKRQALYFLCIGGFGFLVDAGVLTWLVTVQNWGLYSGRAVSFFLAVTATWYLNRRITFIHHTSPARGCEYVLYLSTQTVGAVINLGVYAGVIARAPELGSYPVIPLGFGAAAALVFNFSTAKKFVFKRRPSDQAGNS